MTVDNCLVAIVSVVCLYKPSLTRMSPAGETDANTMASDGETMQHLSQTAKCALCSVYRQEMPITRSGMIHMYTDL